MADEKYTKGRLYNETMEKNAADINVCHKTLTHHASCAGAMSGLTGCGNNTNDTDDNAVNEVEDGVEDGVDDIVDDLDPDDTEKNDTGKNDTDNTR